MDLLQLLVETPGVPGREDRVRAAIEKHVRQAGIFDEIRIDAMGSLIGRRSPRPKTGIAAIEPLRILVAAHMDQIGFIVSHVGGDGLVRLQPVGWFDPRTLAARRVTLVTEAGEDLPGVLSSTGRPMQVAEGSELTKSPDLATLYVDLGLPAEVVQEKVRKGDMVVLDGPFERVGQTVVGGALDDRLGCWALIRALESLTHHDCEICAVWTTQEELGSRGVGPVAEGYRAEIGIACDTIACCQVPGVPEELHISDLGRGVALVLVDGSMLADIGLVQAFERIGAARGIPTQRSLISGGGQDGAQIQRSREGVRVVVLSCPVKHMHTTVEMADTRDIDAYPKLLTAFLETASREALGC